MSEDHSSIESFGNRICPTRTQRIPVHSIPQDLVPAVFSEAVFSCNIIPLFNSTQESIEYLISEV